MMACLFFYFTQQKKAQASWLIKALRKNPWLNPIKKEFCKFAGL
jgi:hypothetical protein